MKTFSQWLLIVCGIVSLSGSVLGSTSPVGFVSYSFPATATGSTYYLSVPLLGAVSSSGTPTAVGSNTITVSSAGWTDSQFVQQSNDRPYYALITSGSAAGRPLLITANTSTQLTVDISDDSPQSTDLTTSGFALTTSNSFEISAGNTLRSLFGDGGSAFPGTGNSLSEAGGIGLWNSKLQAFDYYYQSLDQEQWVKAGGNTSIDMGDTIVPPGATVAVQLPAGYSGGRLIATGRPMTVAPLLKTTGNNAIRYYGIRIPVDMAFSQLNFGSNWTKSNSILTADTLSVYNASLAKWESYYQNTSGTWLKAGSGSSQNSTVIAAGSAVAVLKRAAVSGASSFLPVPLPYTP